MSAEAAPTRVSTGWSLPSGWPFTLWATVATGTLCSFMFTLTAGGAEGWSAVIRTSAKTSLLFFSTPFIASSLRAVWRTRGTAWLLANRRYIGVSFAASHAIHLLAIVQVARLNPEFRFDPTTVVIGGIGYLFLALMTATSFDRSAAWLGARRWKAMHKTGMYYLWFVFFMTYAQLAAAHPARYAPMVMLLVAALALRCAVAYRQRRAKS